MTSFSRMLTDKISIIKKNGELISDVKASVQSERIFIFRSDIHIEPGDMVTRHLSNGAEESFCVVDPNFHEGLGGIKPHYQMKVKKLGIPDDETKAQNVIYNITGNNSRLNQNSVDQSRNLVTINADVSQKLAELRSEIRQAILEPEVTEEALEIVDSIEETLKSEKPRISIVKTLISALPNVGNVASIGSFIISYLQSM